MKKLYILVTSYLVGIIGLFFYSYTQVDLSLTLSRFSIWQVIEKGFQYVGYYQRPLSTGVYLCLLLLLFGSYIGFIYLAQKEKLKERTLWILIGLTALILAFSYNAFSYDLFNYIFDARIVTHYHLNPYYYRALDFAHDPMLSFMHWVERTYPYGPFWLLLTLPFSFLGFQVFLVTFYLFKLIAIGGYLGTAWGIYKIAKKVTPTRAIQSVVLFAFQPLVLIEGLVSGHNDIIMIMFSALSLYFLLQQKTVRSISFLILSVGVKFATAVLVPLWGVVWYFDFKKKAIPWEKMFIGGLFLSIIPIIAASIRTNFQPWYFLYIFPFGALVHKKWSVLSISIFSSFALLEYTPYLFTGNWNPPIPELLVLLTTIGVLVSLGSIGFLFIQQVFIARKSATIA